MHLEEDPGAGYVAHPCHWETALQGIVYVLEVMQDDELAGDSGGVEEGCDTDF